MNQTGRGCIRAATALTVCTVATSIAGIAIPVTCELRSPVTVYTTAYEILTRPQGARQRLEAAAAASAPAAGACISTAQLTNGAFGPLLALGERALGPQYQQMI